MSEIGIEMSELLHQHIIHNNNNNSYNITKYSIAIYLATALIVATVCFIVITCSLLADFSTDKVGSLWRRRTGVLIITGKNNFIPVFALPFRVTHFLSANQLNCAKLGESRSAEQSSAESVWTCVSVGSRITETLNLHILQSSYCKAVSRLIAKLTERYLIVARRQTCAR